MKNAYFVRAGWVVCGWFARDWWVRGWWVVRWVVVGCCCGVGEVVVGASGVGVGFFARVARTKFTRRKKCVYQKLYTVSNPVLSQSWL